MTIYNYDDLKLHVGHKIVCIHYKDVVISANPNTGEVHTTNETTIECNTCHEILYSEFEEEKDGGSAC